MVFPGQGIHSWEVIDALIRLHPVQLVNLHCAISPQQVPLVVWIRVVWHVWGSWKAHFKHWAGNVSHYIVLSQTHIHHKLLSFESAFFLCLLGLLKFAFLFFLLATKWAFGPCLLNSSWICSVDLSFVLCFTVEGLRQFLGVAAVYFGRLQRHCSRFLVLTDHISRRVKLVDAFLLSTGTFLGSLIWPTCCDTSLSGQSR